MELLASKQKEKPISQGFNNAPHLRYVYYVMYITFLCHLKHYIGSWNSKYLFPPLQAYHIIYRSPDKTLTQGEVNVIHAKIEEEAVKMLNVEIR